MGGVLVLVLVLVGTLKPAGNRPRTRQRLQDREQPRTPTTGRLLRLGRYLEDEYEYEFELEDETVWDAMAPFKSARISWRRENTG
jgi:hypothetical protein